MPPPRRAAVAALWALDERFARIVIDARDAMIGQLKLAWWRDALTALDSRPPPGEPLLQALSAHVLPVGVSGSDMAAMAEGWDALLPPDAVDDAALAVHASERGERLFALTGRLLGGEAPPGTGAVWAPVNAMRSVLLRRQEPWRNVAPRLLPAQAHWERSLRPLGMLYLLALRGPAERQGSPARVLRMLRHRLTGR